jgi:hypothetical protein
MKAILHFDVCTHPTISSGSSVVIDLIPEEKRVKYETHPSMMSGFLARHKEDLIFLSTYPDFLTSGRKATSVVVYTVECSGSVDCSAMELTSSAQLKAIGKAVLKLLNDQS